MTEDENVDVKTQKKGKAPKKKETAEQRIEEDKAREYLEMAQRIQADYDNYRKRTQKEVEDFKKFATEGLVRSLLTIIDDFDRALDNAGEENDFVIGIRGIRSNLMKTLEENGLKEIDAAGRFNPDFHEALCVVESDTEDEIAEVFQKGYMMNDRVLRYSKVKVTRKTQ